MELIKRKWFEISNACCHDPQAFGNWQTCIERMAEIDKEIVEDANWRIYQVVYEKEYTRNNYGLDVINHEKTTRTLYMSWEEIIPILEYAIWQKDVSEIEND